MIILRPIVRLIAAFALVVAGLLATSLPAHAAPLGTVLLTQMTRCYPADRGSALVQVHPPGILPGDATYQRPGTITIGDNSQRITLRPYLQVWDGTRWVITQYGPTFTGLAGQTFTSWDGGTGGTWTFYLPAQRSTAKHYRLGVQIWWLADASHRANYAAGLGLHQQWRSIAWYAVDYCSY